jgi:hypothetical protein
MALQTVFMAGLTLVYCLWISPEEIFDATTSNGIHDCSIVLFVIADRVPAAKKYRNAFEVIRQRVIDRISTTAPAERRSRETVPGLTAELAASASYPFDAGQGSAGDEHFDVDEGSLEQLSYILTDMAGEQFPGYMHHPEDDAYTSTYLDDGIDFAMSKGTQAYQYSGDIHLKDNHGVELGNYNTEFSSSYNLSVDQTL